MGVTHSKVSGLPNPADTTLVGGEDWDADHVVDLAVADVTGLQTALDGKSATTHNHTGTYSPTAHNHDSSYSATSHTHTGVYATAGHDHSGVYSDAAHTHSGVYSLTSHVHAAADTSVTDAGGYFTGTDVEAVLQEVGDLLGAEVVSASRVYACLTFL